MTQDRDRQIEDLARRALDNAIEALDSVTTARLAAARRRALDAVQPGYRWAPFAGWATAASVILALSVWWWQAPADPEVSAEDFEMLVSGERLDLYEDLEFYEWLGGQNDAS